MYLFELLVYETRLTSTQVDDVTNYLNKKWNIYNSNIHNYPFNMHINAIDNVINQTYATTVELLKQNSDTKTDKRFISSSDKTISEIEKEISENVKGTIKLKSEIDESLIGGVVLQIGSLMIDTSIKNKLANYKKVLLES